MEADFAPSRSLVRRRLPEADFALAGLEEAARSPRLDVVLPLLVRGLHSLYREEEYPFAMVADLDLKSRHPQRFEWTSYLRKGRLVRVTRGERHASHFVVRWDETLPLNTHTATKNRSLDCYGRRLESLSARPCSPRA